MARFICDGILTLPFTYTQPQFIEMTTIQLASLRAYTYFIHLTLLDDDLDGII
jgi:hypothetical protein